MSSSKNTVPQHIAFIMDGNGRWAEARGLPRSQGHLAGVKSLISLSEAAFKRGVKILSLYAFSSENWNRPPEEIEALMQLLTSFLHQERERFINGKIQLRTIGDLSPFSKEIQEAIASLKEETKNFSERTLVIALNYGSRAEVLNAIKHYIADIKPHEQNAPELTWEKFSHYLYTADLPDPDLLIRTSGEIRLSNFLMLQAAYSELYFTEVMWPDFSPEELEKALNFYSKRERRFGKTSAQIKQNT